VGGDQGALATSEHFKSPFPADLSTFGDKTAAAGTGSRSFQGADAGPRRAPFLEPLLRLSGQLSPEINEIDFGNAPVKGLTWEVAKTPWPLRSVSKVNFQQICQLFAMKRLWQVLAAEVANAPTRAPPRRLRPRSWSPYPVANHRRHKFSFVGNHRQRFFSYEIICKS